MPSIETVTGSYLTINKLAEKHGVSRQTIFALLRDHPERETRGIKITERLILYPPDILREYLPSERHQHAGIERAKSASKQVKKKRKNKP